MIAAVRAARKGRLWTWMRPMTVSQPRGDQREQVDDGKEFGAAGEHGVGAPGGGGYGLE